MSLKTRIKTLFGAALVTASLWTGQAFAAGTLPIALAQQVDINGQPLAGCIVNFFVAGTVATPQNSFSDFGLSQNPLAVLNCDQAGRVPMFWLADGLVHVRLTDEVGTPIIDTTMQVLGPSSGGGGGGATVDPTSIMATGDLKVKYGTGSLTGFVRANALTIGSSTSGATERANADTQALFIYLYGADPNLAVSGGRTGNALNDFNANKQLTLPDWRGRAMAGLDDMGNSAAGRLTATYFGCAATVLGCAGGGQSTTLLPPFLPPYTPSAVFGVTFPGKNLNVVSPSASNPAFISAGNDGNSNIGSFNFSVSATFNPQGGTSTPFATVSPAMLATIYMKL